MLLGILRLQASPEIRPLPVGGVKVIISADFGGKQSHEMGPWSAEKLAACLNKEISRSAGKLDAWWKR